MQELHPFMAYFDACYRADNREVILQNFYGNKVEYPHTLSRPDELLNTHLPYIPLSDAAGETLAKMSALYRGEKELLLGAFFVTGLTTDLQGRESKVCSPLLLYPTQVIEKEGFFYLQADLKKCRINYSAFRIVGKTIGRTINTDTRTFQRFPKGEMDFGTIGKIIRILEKEVPEIDASPLLYYPDLLAEATLKRKLQPKMLQKQGGFKVVSAMAVGLIEKPAESRGVLNELNQLTKASMYSDAIQALFGEEPISNFDSIPIEKVPANLSEGQTEALELANTYPFGVITGPPGTGKSFTIANMAIEQMAQGKTVLIVSRNDEAVDVVAEKIEAQLGLVDVIVRAGRKQYLRKIKAYFEELLRVRRRKKKRMLPANYPEKLQSEIAALEHRIEQIKTTFQHITDKELEWSEFFAARQDMPLLSKQLKNKFKKWSDKNATAHWELLEALHQTENKQIQTIKERIYALHQRRLNDAVKSKRQDFQNFLQALKGRTIEAQQKRFAQIPFESLLEALPIWLVKLSDLHKVLPLQANLFDVLIVDEASQCDIASVLPAMQRAKQTFAVGDAKQLSHISFLSQHKQLVLQNRWDLSADDYPFLDYRAFSFLDFVDFQIQSNEQLAFLDEHYRSCRKIIEFSNIHFYNRQLKIMSARPYDNDSTGLHLTRTKGSRSKKGANPIEAETVVNAIIQQVEAQSHLSETEAQTIGVLSPFRSQTKLLGDLIFERLGFEAIEKHQVKIGTAFSFQGEEKDLMFISLAVDDQSHSGSFTYLNREDVFNVSITRARAQQYVYYSFDPAVLSRNHLIKRYIDSAYSEPHVPAETAINQQHSKALTQFIDTLSKHGFNGLVGFEVAGQVVDVLLEKDHFYLGIDLIGFPGPYTLPFSKERYAALARAGIRTFPLPYTYWEADPEQCIHKIRMIMEPGYERKELLQRYTKALDFHGYAYTTQENAERQWYDLFIQVDEKYLGINLYYETELNQHTRGKLYKTTTNHWEIRVSRKHTTDAFGIDHIVAYFTKENKA